MHNVRSFKIINHYQFSAYNRINQYPTVLVYGAQLNGRRIVLVRGDDLVASYWGVVCPSVGRVGVTLISSQRNIHLTASKCQYESES